ncbi:hypothetical protein ACOMHN_043968 [Nucella lapillus]
MMQLQQDSSTLTVAGIDQKRHNVSCYQLASQRTWLYKLDSAVVGLDCFSPRVDFQIPTLGKPLSVSVPASRGGAAVRGIFHMRYPTHYKVSESVGKHMKMKGAERAMEGYMWILGTALLLLVQAMMIPLGSGQVHHDPEGMGK